MANGLFAVAPAAAELIVTEAKEHGGDLCPVLTALLSDSLAGLVSSQQNFHTFYHPYLKAAQVLSGLNGCGPGDADGAFGPGSQAPWTRWPRSCMWLSPTVTSPRPATSRSRRQGRVGLGRLCVRGRATRGRGGAA